LPAIVVDALKPVTGIAERVLNEIGFEKAASPKLVQRLLKKLRASGMG
jgi:hypothetical protein